MHPVRLRGARTHNLRGVDLVLPQGTMVALTGPSGAGKSSLALETLYAEGQRRFVESFSPYARQFLERLERPPMTSLDPIAATVAVDRRAPVKSSRSTLATMADLEPYFAGLFACEARPVCSDCGVEAVERSAGQAANAVLEQVEGRRAIVTYPVRVTDPEAFLELRDTLLKDGYRRLVLGGSVRDLDTVKPSEATAPDVRVEVVVDRISLQKEGQRRLQEAIEAAWSRGHGRAALRLDNATQGDGKSFTEHLPVVQGLVCPSCTQAFEPARSALFSYNSPLGACGQCHGFGRVIGVDWDKVIPDGSKSLAKGAIKAWTGKTSAWERRELVKFAERKGIPMDVPWDNLTETQRNLVLDGEGSWSKGKFPGVKAWFQWLETKIYKMHVRVFLARYRAYALCTACHGGRLNPTALTYRVAGLNLAQWHGLTVADARAKLEKVLPKDPQGKRVHASLASRLAYLDRVGLGYLTLDRQARTLSGGEAQRAGLTTALGASLTGTLFVLDEPTVGLHALDIPALAEVTQDLSRAGNTVLVIEHDEHLIRACDRAVELGPGAGKNGGTILYDGPPEGMVGRNDLPTGRVWSTGPSDGRKPRKATEFLRVKGAYANNLHAEDITLPLGVVCAITGPSGSGKSTLAEDIVYRSVARHFGDDVEKPGAHGGMEGLGALSRAVLVDQSPLGRTARGNAATYTKAWDRVRARFAAESESIRQGLTPGHFSFNVAVGRCDNCAGEGYETVEMQFLADVSLLCPVCQGKRFKPEVLAVKHRGYNVHDVLSMTVDDVLATFDPPDARDYVLRRALEPVQRVGLGYLPLGQPLSTLSGGEAQRLKLARALSEKPAKTLFVIDEPSAGLHGEDASYVVKALHALVEEGASVLLVEHDLDVIRTADWVLDLGPGAGPHGGRVVAEGTPSDLAKGDSKTGLALRMAFAPKKPAGTDRTAGADLGTEAKKSGHGKGAQGKGAPGKSGQEKASKAPAADTAMAWSGIRVSHAREHNLKDVSCTIPHGKLCVVTGPSGSGKSSLAFDVVFAEGQRRFMETLTPYARQFLPMLPRPDVDNVTGVPPSIALEQRTTRGGANSTVATVTEIAHYLRLLYAKVGDVYCPDCDEKVEASSPDDLFEQLQSSKEKARRTVYAPAVRARKGTYLDLFTAASRAGIKTARVDGALVSTDPPPRLAKTKEHTIDLLIHYGPLSALDRATFDRALSFGQGALRVCPGEPAGCTSDNEVVYSTARACSSCGMGVPELDPRWFSFNTKQGQCEDCEGTGIEGGPAALDEAGPHEPCSSCEGSRLAPIPRKVRLFGQTYGEFTAKDVKAALVDVRSWKFRGALATIAEAPHGELRRRLSFVDEVGLGYLALDRAAASLSGGEMQRLRLSAQLGSGLTGALYVLDEPTIGLHPRDTSALLRNLRALVDTGSTVLVVEHDAETIAAADHVIDVGPTGGRGGGHILAEGPATDVLRNPQSLTARALVETARVERPKRPMADQWVELSGATANNLQNATLRLPLGRMNVIAGVSGSGKSTLVRQVFYPALRRALGLVADEPGAFKNLKGYKSIKRAMAVDQSPIGRTPRSVPATFLGIWDDIRNLFASLPEAKTRGYNKARFSFNSNGGGRCPACEGQGVTVSEMAFLPDIATPCETCGGARFEPATLDITYQGLTIGDVLRLSAEDASQVFSAHRRIASPLRTLNDLGVGYLAIGQGSNTLSGGEAQRLKLASELTAGAAHEPTLYVLDEPTTGLHLSDVRRLINVLERLVERGDTLVIVEHHPDVIASGDWVVELGPEAGRDGGRVVFEGEPKALRKAKTATGKYLAAHPSPQGAVL